MTFPSPTLIWFKDGWQDEYVTGLGPPLVMHLRGGRKRAGEFVPRVRRILNSEHILWAVERDLDTRGDYKGKGLKPKKDESGRVVRTAQEWSQPFHEAVKRIRPRERGWEAFRYHWLIAWLRWRHLPCLCAHRDIVAHLAEESAQPEGVVMAGIERAGRQAARLVGDKAGPNPVNPILVRNSKSLSKGLPERQTGVQRPRKAPRGTLSREGRKRAKAGYAVRGNR